jgi:hypothetical protein
VAPVGHIWLTRDEAAIGISTDHHEIQPSLWRGLRHGCLIFSFA